MTSRLAVGQILAALTPAASGVTLAVTRLADAQAACGLDVAILSVGETERADRAGVRYETFSQDFGDLPVLRRLSASQGLARAVDVLAREGTVLHTHGLWLACNLYAGWSARRHRSPLVVSPHGMLAPAALRFSSRKKQVFWALAQGPALSRAACWHVTSTQEFEELRDFGIAAPIALVPLGIDVPPAAPYLAGPRRTLLSLGRVHPKKGLDRLVAAWAQVEDRHPDWDLRITGPSERGHAEELRRQAQALGARRIAFEDGLYGADKLAAYAAADVFVLPSLNENFGFVVAEALACGVPVVCTRGAPWPGLAEHGCGWWIDHGVAPLVAALEDAMGMPPAALAEMGARGRRWMAADFSWDRTARDLIAVYRWCAGAGDRPASVIL
ncbi:glycosyltransferase [Aquabacter spiritensis]|uniref:Glycosyltransferase involved in cell wall biosynthesis n=1 Tax=Aquabacter spiritensis TaxID=933073 RepID=A0A4R3LW70_9HYPH|nr:glycosyltransferase [Aquabacter spiritensis]TCT03969.1 glycosyltransferase involved in cell wall biosynthesis [Aquabacter spiritensis]